MQVQIEKCNASIALKNVREACGQNISGVRRTATSKRDVSQLKIAVHTLFVLQTAPRVVSIST